MKRGAVAALLLTCGSVLTVCTDASPASPTVGGQLAIGTWGGDSAGIIVADSLTHVHIACTQGDIPFRLTLGNDGRFSVAGSYLLKAYPVAVGPTMPAVFNGQLKGSVLTISVVVTDTIDHTVTTRGPATVMLGITPQLGPCPICSAQLLQRVRNL